MTEEKRRHKQPINKMHAKRKRKAIGTEKQKKKLREFPEKTTKTHCRQTEETCMQKMTYTTYFILSHVLINNNNNYIYCYNTYLYIYTHLYIIIHYIYIYIP